MQTAVKSQSSTRRRSSRRRLTSRHHRPLFCRYVETSDALNGVTKFWFDANGQAAVLQDVKGNQIRATYNAIGQRVSVNDPNQGVSSFTYNALGEVLSQTDARGIVSNFTYDKLGRKTKLAATSDANGDGTNDAIIDTWVYDPTGAKGQLSVSKRTINGATERQDTSAFDSIYIRPITQTTVQNTGGATTRTYVTDVQYDGYYGRVKAMFMPNGEGEQFIYNPHGYETEQRNATSAAVYRQVVSTNARGQITRELKGFNLATDTVYWDDGQVKQITHTKNGVAIRQLNYAYDVFGNVATQALNNGLAGNTVENFAYDKLHRLTQSTRTGAASATVSYGYDAAGNFNFKSDFSTATGTPYNLATGGLGGGGANAVKSVALAAGGTRSYGYDASGNMTSDNAGFSAIYDHANLATKLQKGAVTNYFTYGPSNAKAKQTGSDGTKAYVGSYEDWVTANQTKVSLGKYAQVTNGTGGRQLHYFLTDRLGSVDAVTDSVGTLIETRGFDAFGAPRTGTWGDAQQIASTAITPKGFTSHEHLNSLKLIHMNGRIYDYQLGRFMGVDPFIQMPTNSQSLNPYSYIMNNPLAGTDPTGYQSVCAGKDPDCSKTPEPPKETASERRWKMACGGGYCQGSAKIDGNGVGGKKENGARGQSRISNTSKDAQLTGSSNKEVKGLEKLTATDQTSSKDKIKQQANDFLNSELALKAGVIDYTQNYTSKDDANIAAANKYLGASLATNREVLWHTYSTAPDKYYYVINAVFDEGVKIGISGSSIKADGLSLVSSGHTHWDGEENFSGTDWKGVLGVQPGSSSIDRVRLSNNSPSMYMANARGVLQETTPKAAHSKSLQTRPRPIPPESFSGREVTRAINRDYKP
jgi:RHS repeat-associated protein